MFKVQNVCSGAGSRSERVSMGVMCSYISVRDGAVELLGSFQIKRTRFNALCGTSVFSRKLFMLADSISKTQLAADALLAEQREGLKTC